MPLDSPALDHVDGQVADIIRIVDCLACAATVQAWGKQLEEEKGAHSPEIVWSNVFGRTVDHFDRLEGPDKRIHRSWRNV